MDGLPVDSINEHDSPVDFIDELLGGPVIDQFTSSYLDELQPRVDGLDPWHSTTLGTPADPTLMNLFSCAPGGPMYMETTHPAPAPEQQQLQQQQQQPAVATRGKRSADPPEPAADGATKSGRSKATPASKQARQAAVQDKNRRAQRRFRERQKIKQEDQARAMENMTAENKRLQAALQQAVNRADLLEHMVAITKPAEDWAGNKGDLKDVKVEEDLLDQCCTTMTTVLTLRGHEREFSYDQLANMTIPQMHNIWSGYVQELRGLLEDGSPAAAAKIGQYVNELCIMVMRVSVVNPLRIKEMHACNDESLAPDQRRDLATWNRVTTELGLTPDQRRQIMEMRRVHINGTKQLIEERLALNDAIRAAMPAVAGTATDVTHNACELGTRRFLVTHDCVERLKCNLCAEHKLRLTFVATMLKKVLTPVQTAQIMVAAYPACPDSVSISCCVAYQEGCTDPDMLGGVDPALMMSRENSQDVWGAAGPLPGVQRGLSCSSGGSTDLAAGGLPLLSAPSGGEGEVALWGLDGGGADGAPTGSVPAVAGQTAVHIGDHGACTITTGL